MRIAAVRVFELQGPARSGQALYETARGSLAPAGSVLFLSSARRHIISYPVSRLQ